MADLVQIANIKGTVAANRKTPTGANDPSGAVGDVCWDNSYIYLKTTAGWRRAPLAAW